MKIKYLFLASAVLTSLACHGRTCSNDEQSNNGGNHDVSFIQNYKVTPPANLKISTVGGNISVTGREDNTIEVSFIVAKRGQVLEITYAQLKDYADVEIINDNSNLEIKVKKTFENNISVGFSIKTPVKSSTSLNTSGGNLSLAGVTGNQTLNTSGGNINLENIAGTTDAKTSGGNISVNNSSSDFKVSTSGGNISTENIDGKMEVSTSGGNIYAKNMKTGFTGHTSGGNVDLNSVQGTIDVGTSGGSIRLDQISGTVKANTSGGDIKATIIKLTGKVDLETSGGSIKVTVPSKVGLNLDLSADEISTPLANFTGTAKKNRINGQMNGGGIVVHLNTDGGSISLNYD